MNKPAILIVEDEPLIADDVAATLERHGYAIVDIVDEASSALEILDEHHVDLALLDVNIEGEEDGISLAARIDVPFIFLTSYYDKATLERAARVNPAAYLVKPFSENDLIANVEMALKKAPKRQSKSSAPEKLFVKKDQEIVAIMSNQILYAEAFDNYTNLYTETERYIISHTLKSVEAKLIPLGFLRIHRSYLINFEMIDSIAENYVFLKGQKVPLGKSYRKEFMESISLL